MISLESRHSLRCVSLAFLMGLTCSLVAVNGYADSVTSSSAAAQALFDQAKELIREGRYSEACPKLEESQRLDPGSGTLINLADCYERLGRAASAWSTFLEAGTAAEAAGNAPRAETARVRAAALAPGLAKVTIVVTDPHPESALQITRDGANVGQAQWSAAIPIDEGSHSFTASAPGKQPWSTTIVIQGKGSNTQVIIPVLNPEPKAPSAEPRTLPARAPHAARSSGHTGAERGIGIGPQRTAALVSAGVGLVGLSLGTVFGLQSKAARDKADDYCNDDECWDDRGMNLKSDAIANGNLSTALFVAGAVGVAGAAILWFSTEPMQRAQSARVGVGLGRLALEGKF